MQAHGIACNLVKTYAADGADLCAEILAQQFLVGKLRTHIHCGVFHAVHCQETLKASFVILLLQRLLVLTEQFVEGGHRLA